MSYQTTLLRLTANQGIWFRKQQKGEKESTSTKSKNEGYDSWFSGKKVGTGIHSSFYKFIKKFQALWIFNWVLLAVIA